MIDRVDVKAIVKTDAIDEILKQNVMNPYLNFYIKYLTIKVVHTDISITIVEQADAGLTARSRMTTLYGWRRWWARVIILMIRH